ncbi:hypothetical protein J7K93_03160 [bacterium]|nr:hypothetical protein [bacterium]
MLCFTGKFPYGVDSKRRINIPASAVNELFREHEETGSTDNKKELKQTDIIFHITRGPNDCLFVYPRDVFARKAARLNSHFGYRGTEDDEERRYFLETVSDAHPVRCDNQGRITVPQEHLDYAKIKDKVMVIGAIDHLELWSPDIYNMFIAQSSATPKDRVRRYGWVEKEDQ